MSATVSTWTGGIAPKFDPEQCGGRPCIRHLRIRVQDVLELLADGMTPEEIVRQLPDLEVEDVKACTVASWQSGQ